MGRPAGVTVIEEIPLLGTFGAATHDEVLQLVVQIAVLLATARLFGWIAQRLGRPAVVGEILAGVLLGPWLLFSIFPLVESWIVPQTEVQGHLVEVISLVGVMLLLILTGLETDLALIRRRIGVAFGVAGVHILTPTHRSELGLDYASDITTELETIGTSVRAWTSRLHLGPRVEYLARQAPCPVVILNT